MRKSGVEKNRVRQIAGGVRKGKGGGLDQKSATEPDKPRSRVRASNQSHLKV